MDYRIKETLVHIERDISQPLAIPDLAASLNLSASRFRHLFKKEVQICPVKYINNRRLERARALLQTTHLRVKEIRLKVGVSNEAHFLHDFKRRFGHTPCAYRRQFQDSRNGQ